MKTLKISALIALILLAFSACKKLEDVAPITPATTVITPPINAIKLDTIPDKALLKLQLVKDSFNYDETMFLFKHTATLNYSGDEDGAYFSGYGAESLSSISKDGRDLAINVLPYAQGMAIDLDMNVKASGAYFFKLSYLKNVPASMKIWVKDTYMKDSVDVRTGHYNFTVDKTDANSFGSKRFKLVLRDSGQTGSK